MLEKTRGIIFHSVKFGDNSLILTIYTEQFGRQSFIINAARNSRSKNKAGLLQPLFIADMEIYQKKNREIQRIKEIRLASPYISIPYDMVKTAQTLFIAEILNKIIIEEEQNTALYHFLESSLLFFDLMDKGKSLFHIWFLSHLTGYLGIRPDTNSRDREWLDMQMGNMVAGEPPHPAYMNPGISSLFRKMMETGIRELSGFRAEQDEKILLLDKILEYYTLHFSNLAGLKSAEILRQVFH